MPAAAFQQSPIYRDNLILMMAGGAALQGRQLLFIGCGSPCGGVVTVFFGQTSNRGLVGEERLPGGATTEAAPDPSCEHPGQPRRPSTPARPR